MMILDERSVCAIETEDLLVALSGLGDWRGPLTAHRLAYLLSTAGIRAKCQRPRRMPIRIYTRDAFARALDETPTFSELGLCAAFVVAEIFEKSLAEWVAAEELASALTALKSFPPMTTNHLTQLLAPLGIHAHRHWFGATCAYAYARDPFAKILHGQSEPDWLPIAKDAGEIRAAVHC